MAMMAFAGGEPTLSKDLLPVLRRCQHHGMHTSVATHGGTMTPQLAGELADAGVRYVEVSLDSVHAEKHDAFRGVPGMWQRTVQGMKNVVAEPRLRLGVAMCVHRDNFDEVEEMLQFCEQIGAGSFAHFNFIPVGRGKGMTEQDLTPRQRQELLELLQKWMQKGTLGVISTAPQLGRVCLTHAPADGKVTCSHAGSGSGWKARVVARYLGGCGAGRTYMCIQPNGDVTPCVYLPHRVIGNVRQKPIKEIWLHSETWEVLNDRDQRYGGCAACKYKQYCGGCRARSDAYYGDLIGPDPGCVFNQKEWDKIVSGEELAGTCGTCETCAGKVEVGSWRARQSHGQAAALVRPRAAATDRLMHSPGDNRARLRPTRGTAHWLPAGHVTQIRPPPARFVTQAVGGGNQVGQIEVGFGWLHPEQAGAECDLWGSAAALAGSPSGVRDICLKRLGR